MNLIQTPEPFSPAFGEILYAVSLEEAERGREIGIFNSPVTEKIGIKKATEAPVFNLHVSDYVRSQIGIEPFPRRECAIIDASERTYYSCIAYGNWASSTPHTAGILPVALNEPMTGQKIRFLGEDEQDEIGWIAEKGPVFARALFPVKGNEPLDIHLGRMEVDEPRMLGLVINSGHLDQRLRERDYRWGDFSRFILEIHSSHRVVSRFEYRIRPHNCHKTRLAWWNRYGAIDFYSFETIREIKYNIEKKQVGHESRKRNTVSTSRPEIRVATACATREQIQWLSGIAGAPQVWVEEKERFVPVEMLDFSLPVYHPDRTDFEIRFQYAEGSPFQTF